MHVLVDFSWETNFQIFHSLGYLNFVHLFTCFNYLLFPVAQVIGQFNLGFIIGKLDQDLFIVDQVTVSSALK